MTTEFTIGRLAETVGVNIQTIRYYERLKLLAPTARMLSGYRLYGTAEVQRLRFIKNAQALGFTLHEITGLLNLRVNSTARCGDVQRQAQEHLHNVEAKLQDLEAIARALRNLIRSCRAGQSTDRCPILKSLENEPRRLNHGNRKKNR